MDYVHVRNLEKFHPGYKDRSLQWAKIHCTMAQGDPDCDLITDEIDWCRLVKFILLELEAKKPIPLDDQYLTKKGFNLKKRPISKTLLMLHNFIDTLHNFEDSVPRVEKSRVEEDKDSGSVTDFFSYYVLKTKKQFKLTEGSRELISKRLKDGFTVEQMKVAVDNFVNDEWPDRNKHLDLIYCIGIRNKVDNLQKWLNIGSGETSKYKEADKDCVSCGGTGWVYIEAQNGNAVCSCRKVGG